MMFMLLMLFFLLFLSLFQDMSVVYGSRDDVAEHARL